MDAFDLKNRLRCSFAFTASDGSATQPTSAICTVNYPKPDGARRSEKIALSKDVASGRWIGFWDSRKATDGEVDWLAECFGPLIGSLKGTFLLEGNRAYPLPPIRS